MPATENTWRDLKLMHVIFGCTSLLLLITTIWMFVDDHSRQWKGYQRRNRSVETTLTQWRMEQQARENADQRARLQAELDAELAVVPPRALIDELKENLNERDASDAEELEQIYSAMSESSDENERRRLRSKFLNRVGAIVNRARFAESNASRERKFKSAEYDEARAKLDIGIRDQVGEAGLQELQAAVDEIRAEREELTENWQAAEKYLKKIQGVQQQIKAKEDEIRKKITDNSAEYNRLTKALEERQATYFVNGVLPGKRFLEMPIIDAFNSPLKITNLWTDGLTIPNGSFGQVRRFDRCTTCHQNIDKTATGSAVAPAYEHEHRVTLLVQTPDAKPKPKEVTHEDGSVETQLPSLLRDYGFALADTGLLNDADVTISQIMPGSEAAKAVVTFSEYGVENESVGFLVGDVIEFIGPDKVLSPNDVEQMLMRDASWGSTFEIRIRRGLAHPFSSHPRLDLFVGSLSPHKVNVFGCTVCHEGQGSATDFKWASHTPNDPVQAEEWSKRYGWFNNHHWIYPMYPKRFRESSCLRCHHDVVELDASQRFPDPPAPTLVRGYNLVREYGCYGCHEINGYKTADKRQGPDLRLEPNYSAAASQLKADPAFASLEKEQQGWIRELILHPERVDLRHQLIDFLKGDSKSESPRLAARSHVMADVLADVETPGDLRKVGPSLRYVASKVGASFLYDWIRDPRHFRPSTRMPAFFGQWKHLESEPKALEQAQRFEPIEILGIVEYLRDKSQTMEFDARIPEDADSDEAAIERGKLVFETRGCLACHMHADFPDGKATQGPDLSNMGGKLSLADTADARQWLYNWVRSPSSYHPRTKMPDLFLLPIENPDGSTTDPAADVVAYLLSSKTDWQPREDNRLTPDRSALKEVVLEHLKTKVFEADAVAALAEGKIPDEIAVGLKGAETALVGERITDKMMLLYVGEKSISKYGCFACHDIPGFEDAKPIGTALADWGRKEPAKLAFEHIVEYIEHGHGQGDTAHAGQPAQPEVATVQGEPTGASSPESPFDESYYRQKLLEHERDGFIWQKLKEPRSYDFMKASNKDSYNERLRMPQFRFSPEEREAVVTFVLGLVAEPPAHQFVYHPNADAAALIAGKKAIEKYNCGGCHILEAQQWTVTAPPGSIEVPTFDPETSYGFMKTQFSSEQIEESQQVDRLRGTITAHLSGMPRLNSNTGLFEIYDADGAPLEPEDLEDPELDRSTLVHQFELWQPTLIEGQAVEISANIPVPESIVTRKRPAVGGDLTFLLLPRVTELEKQANPSADGRQAWGWLPPPLVNEGNKVQSDWLHDFLLDPFAIRPATFLRMPKFNMSSAEATDIVRYFAARDHSQYPYKTNVRADEQRLAAAERAYREELASTPEDQRPSGDDRFDHAMNIVTSSDYCVQCHIVGDFEPKTSDRAKAPNLAGVERRLQPDFVRTWIANPKQVLAYTPMPVNIKYDANSPTLGGVDQKLYHGTSVDQLDGVVDLLMNYSRYTSGKANVAGLVRPSTQPPAGPSTAATTPSP
jgi:mono/diheme cytochrome c family protein